MIGLPRSNSCAVRVALAKKEIEYWLTEAEKWKHIG
jgi:hypothetical protein